MSHAFYLCNKLSHLLRPLVRDVLYVRPLIGCEAKYELTKKRSLGGISGCEIEVFGLDKEEKGITCKSYFF